MTLDGRTGHGRGRLQGRSAIVTGAAQGIGSGIAEVFAREGARVMIADLNDALGVETARRIARDYGTETAFAQVDVTDQSTVEALAAQTVDRFGGIDVLCHNAGVYPQATLEEMTEAEWDRVLDTNLKSGFFLVKSCLPSMKSKRKGRIIFTSSITGPVTAIPKLAHYGASKAGVLGLVRSAAVELAPHNITVNAVLPGNILTPGVQGLGQEYADAQVQRIPLGRLGQPADVGHAMLFFASDEADYVTGQMLIVDGGQTLPEA
jgi:3-oxoacyl-[acyl-carrier protein] reductase